MIDATQRHLRSALRSDLTAFIYKTFGTIVPGERLHRNWHIEAIAYQLERIRRNEINRLIITMPPRSLKSICVSVAFPAFVLGHDPTRRIIGLSYSQDLSAKHARGCRAVMQAPWYLSSFPRTRISLSKNTELEFETTAGGFRLATSIDGTLTGRGGNLIVIDDPMKPGEVPSESRRRAIHDFYGSTLLTRLDDKQRDAIVVVMQRLHVDDLVGHILAKGDHWEVLNLPAIAPEPEIIQLGNRRAHVRRQGDLLHKERESVAVLEELKRAMGSQLFSAQYQQAPVPPEGAIIKRRWLRRFEVRPERRPGDQIVQSWDTASKSGDANNYSVCTTWLMRGEEYYLIDVVRERLEFPDLKRRVIAEYEKYRPNRVLMEEAASGIHLIQELKRDGKVFPIAIKPERDKETRLHGVTAMIESGQALFPESAPWLDSFEAEILAFPNGHYDDQVDSLSQFLTWARDQTPFFGIEAIG